MFNEIPIFTITDFISTTIVIVTTLSTLLDGSNVLPNLQFKSRTIQNPWTFYIRTLLGYPFTCISWIFDFDLSCSTTATTKPSVSVCIQLSYMISLIHFFPFLVSQFLEFNPPFLSLVSFLHVSFSFFFCLLFLV